MHTISQKRNLAFHSWEPFLQYGERKFLKKKSLLYNQGDIGTGFYYIHKGLIKVVTTTEKGNRILDIKGTGFLIGEQVIDQKPYFSSAITLEESVVYYFSLETYKHLMMEFPNFVLLFANSVIQKIKTLLDEVNLKSFSSEQQVAFSLLQLTMFCNTNKINLTQKELADYVGLTRITIYKIIKKWKHDKIIDVHDRKLLIHRPDILESYITT